MHLPSGVSSASMMSLPWLLSLESYDDDELVADVDTDAEVEIVSGDLVASDAMASEFWCIHFLRNFGGSFSSFSGTSWDTGIVRGDDVEDDGDVDGGDATLSAPFFRGRRALVVALVVFSREAGCSTSISSSVARPLPFLSHVFDMGFGDGGLAMLTLASRDGPASGNWSEFQPFLHSLSPCETISTPLIPPDIGTRSLVLNPLSTPTRGPKSAFDDRTLSSGS